MGSSLSTSNGNDLVHSIECCVVVFLISLLWEKKGKTLFLKIFAAASKKIGIVLTLEGTSEIIKFLLFKADSPK